MLSFVGMRTRKNKATAKSTDIFVMLQFQSLTLTDEQLKLHKKYVILACKLVCLEQITNT